MRMATEPVRPLAPAHSDLSMRATGHTHTFHGQVVWVSGRRPHSRLPQSLHVNHGVDEVTLDHPEQPPASVARRTDARAACPAHPLEQDRAKELSGGSDARR